MPMCPCPWRLVCQGNMKGRTDWRWSTDNSSIKTICSHLRAHLQSCSRGWWRKKCKPHVPGLPREQILVAFPETAVHENIHSSVIQNFPVALRWQVPCESKYSPKNASQTGRRTNSLHSREKYIWLFPEPVWLWNCPPYIVLYYNPWCGVVGIHLNID